MTVYLSLAVAVLGIVLYMLSPDEKVKQLSLYGFAVALLAFLLHAMYLVNWPGMPK